MYLYISYFRNLNYEGAINYQSPEELKITTKIRHRFKTNSLYRKHGVIFGLIEILPEYLPQNALEILRNTPCKYNLGIHPFSEWVYKQADLKSLSCKIMHLLAEENLMVIQIIL